MYYFLGLGALVLLFLFLYYKRRKSWLLKNRLIIVGPIDSGKTSLFHKLIYNQEQITVASLKINEDDFHFGTKVLKVYDIPGLSSLDQEIVNQLKTNQVCGIIFLVDSSSEDHYPDAALKLCEIIKSGYTGSILVLCNKQDEKLARRTTMIEEKLAKEIVTLKGKPEHQVVGFRDKKTFEFQDILKVQGIKVKFAQSSIKRSELKEVIQYLESLETI